MSLGIGIDIELGRDRINRIEPNIKYAILFSYMRVSGKIMLR